MLCRTSISMLALPTRPSYPFGSLQGSHVMPRHAPHLLAFVPVPADVASRRRFGPRQVRYVGSMGENDPKTWFAIILFLLFIIAVLIWYGPPWQAWG